jgi:uncharacterized protein involved in exopolysaccharide biosynthesis
MAEPEKKTPRDIMRVVFRRKWLFLLGASLFAFASMCGAHYIPLKYTGEAKFARKSDPAAKMSGQVSESFDTIKLTLEQDLFGREAVESIVTALGLDRGLPHDTEGKLTPAGVEAKQQIIERIQKSTKLTWEVRSADSDLISVSVTHEDPNLAQRIPNALVKGYIERTYGVINTSLTESRDFLVTQVETCKSRLSSLETERNTFEVAHASMMPESPGVVQKRIDDLNAGINKLDREKLTAQDKLREATRMVVRLSSLFPHAADSLSAQDANQLKDLVVKYWKSQPASRPTSMPATELASGAASQPATQPAEEDKGPNPEYERLKQQLRDLEQAVIAEQTLRHKTDAHPAIQALKARIAQVKKELEDTPERLTQKVSQNPARLSNTPTAPLTDPLGIATIGTALSDWNLAARECNRLEDDYRVIKASYDNGVALMANFAPTRQKYMEITKKIADTQAELASWQGRLSGIEMSLAAESAGKRTHLAAIQPAQEQFLPSSPALLMVLGFSIGGALAFGVGLVFLANMFDRTISTPDGVAEEFGLPVHGVIGEIVLPKEQLKRRLKSWVAVPAVLAIIVVCLAWAGLSIFLWLRGPEDYKLFHAAPATYVYQNVVQRAVQWITGFFH